MAEEVPEEVNSPQPPSFLEVVCRGSGEKSRFAAGTKAGFAVSLMDRKLGIGLHIEAVKKGEEPISFGPDAVLVNYGNGWKLQTVRTVHKPEEVNSPQPPSVLEVVCQSSGKKSRFAAGTKAGFAVRLMNSKLGIGAPLALHIEAVKKGEEPISFGPDAVLVNYGNGWKLQTVCKVDFPEKVNSQQPPSVLEVVCQSSGKKSRFAAGTKAGFAVWLMNRKLGIGAPLALHIEAVKKGEEPISFGPDAVLVNYGNGWKLRTVCKPEEVNSPQPHSRTEIPEVRDAAREAALREIKERIKKTKDEKKAKKAEVAAKQQKTLG